MHNVIETDLVFFTVPNTALSLSMSSGRGGGGGGGGLLELLHIDILWCVHVDFCCLTMAARLCLVNLERLSISYTLISCCISSFSYSFFVPCIDIENKSQLTSEVYQLTD